jgi:hypothetical protein
VGAAALATAVLAGCTGHSGKPVAMGAQQGEAAATVVVPQEAPALPAMNGTRLKPDVLVTGPLTRREVRAVRSLARATAAFTLGTARIGRTTVRIASVDPATFRRYAAPGTAESTALWQTVAAGQLVVSHAMAKQLHLVLGRDVTIAAERRTTVRLGGLATTGIPGTDMVVDFELGALLES